MTSSPPSIGLFIGRPDRCARLATRLRGRGWPVTHYNTTAFDGEPYVPVPGEFHSALARVLRTRHDAYFTGLSHVPSFCLYVNRLLRGKPYVYNTTGAMWEMFRDRSRGRPFPRLFERRIHPFLLEHTYAGASRIVSNSRFLERKIAERYPKVRDRLLTIYNGIDADHYASGTRQRIAGSSSDDIVLVCVTTLNYHGKSSGLGVVLEAFRHVREKDRRAKLVVCAKTSDPRYREWAESYVSDPSFADSVILRVNEPGIPDVLASADVFVYATPDDSNDSLPRALLEAQAAGLPAVASSTSGCPEVVVAGETGELVPYEPLAMAGAILDLMHDPGRRRRMSEAARARIRQVFDWDRMADAYAEIFCAITGRVAC